MQKIIVERPRLGSTRRNFDSSLRLSTKQVNSAVASGEDFDSGPARASSSRRDKWLNENLAPLRRYLHSQIGRPWNKVFSEIRRNLDTRSAIGLHVMQHLEQFIDLRTLMRDGSVYSMNRCEMGPAEGLFVHPVTGLIRYVKPKPRKRWSWMTSMSVEPDFVHISDTSAYRKFDGLWFRAEYAVVDRGKRILVSKRQCDRKTIRRIERGEMGLVICCPSYGGWSAIQAHSPPAANTHRAVR